MFLVETLAGFDALALGVIVGSLLLLTGLVWVLIDNRQFEGFKPAANRPEAGDARTTAGVTPSDTSPAPARKPRTPRAA